MIIGYCRVSTAMQGRTGSSLIEQEEALRAKGATKIFSEAYTGTKADRPEFNKALATLHEGDTLMVTKLDRFARSAEDAIHIIKSLLNKGITVHILNMGITDGSPMGKLMITILSGFAEFERDMIVERTQGGKAIAKQQPDFKEGRPKLYSPKQLEHALSLLETHSYKQVEEVTGISKSTLIRAKKAKTV